MKTQELLKKLKKGKCKLIRNGSRHDIWYDRRIGLSGIIRGYQAKCRNRHELSEFLDVSEEFLTEALECYREKYGCTVNVGSYIIMFEPYLAVAEKI